MQLEWLLYDSVLYYIFRYILMRISVFFKHIYLQSLFYTYKSIKV